jgi:hypothetical protein
MELGSVFLIFTVILLVGLYISRPFFDRKPVRQRRAALENEGLEHQRSALLAEYDRMLNALQELDFDHVLGKIADEDYPMQRTLLRQAGADILRELDSFHSRASQTLLAESQPSAEDRLEAAIAARRGDSPARPDGADRVDASPARVAIPAAAAAASEDLEALISIRRGSRQEKAGGFCPRCGKPVQKSDRFCPKCGAAIKVS